MRITPIDIQQQQFKSKLVGGYDQADVDSFLEQIAETVEQLNVEQQQLQGELARTRAGLEEMRERESTLKETLITTQKVTDDLKANAKREAELIVANAQLRGERILQETEEKRLQLLAELQELRRQRVEFESNLRSMIEGHLRLLEMGLDTRTAAKPPVASRAAAPPAPPEAETDDQSLF